MNCKKGFFCCFKSNESVSVACSIKSEKPLKSIVMCVCVCKESSMSLVMSCIVLVNQLTLQLAMCWFFFFIYTSEINMSTALGHYVSER